MIVGYEDAKPESLMLPDRSSNEHGETWLLLPTWCWIMRVLQP